jgi:hypothetical protein
MYKSQPTFPLHFFPYRITFDLHDSYTSHLQHNIIQSRVPKPWDTRYLDFTVNVNSQGFHENYNTGYYLWAMWRRINAQSTVCGAETANVL